MAIPETGRGSVMYKAEYWIEKSEAKKNVQCLLCPHVCLIAPQEKGRCRVRQNINGELFSTNYGMVTSIALDPIEKKPFKRFLPGSHVLSMGTFGCNLACQFCQNWTISQSGDHPARFVSPQEACDLAQRALPEGNIGLAYTYSEPTVWYEYVLETAKLVRKANMKNILVTNGFINPQPLRGLLPYIDAVNLDVKAYTDKFYHDICSGSLNPVLRNAKLFAGSCHLEITTLLIPGLNDGDQEIAALAEWLSGINENIPLHLSRYFPNYKMELPPTPLATMYRAKETAEKYLKYVYLGNV